MEEIEEDEDVIIKGGELHKVLVDMGYTDFECRSISKNKSVENLSHRDNYEWKKFFFDFVAVLRPLKRIFTGTKSSYVSSKQLMTILEAENLLDDHAATIRSILDKNKYSVWTKAAEWSKLLASSTILGFTYLFPERRKTSVILFATSLIAISLQRKYEDFCSVKYLQEVVCLQNELHRLYCRGLRALRKGYQLRTDTKQSQIKFSNMEIERLKYLQPLTETLLRSMEKISRIYYRVSSILVKLLPKSSISDEVLSNIDDSFAVEGEITYSTLRHLYYVYILAQSDTMQLLALAYDQSTSTEKTQISESQLTNIVRQLCRSLRSNEICLKQLIDEYENCKMRPIERKYRGPPVSKWRDLYLNLDLLSHKVRTSYDAIGSILEELDKRENLTATEDDFIDRLTPRINDIFKQIDTARNFAEFNNLLVAMLRRSRRRDEDSPIEDVKIGAEIESDRPIEKDADPQIIDEVFEEYITEEYIRPIYEENDDVGMESSRLDELLAKNFMSELKEALIDKYKSMSEREAKALLRKYRETNGHANLASEGNSSVDLVNDREKVFIPRPPPLPQSTLQNEPRIVAEKQTKQSRRPVPLPRMNANTRYRESDSPEIATERFSIPPPPNPPPRKDLSEINQDFSISGVRRIVPAFVTFEEEFIGSGDNSAEESENSDCEEDQEFVEKRRSLDENNESN